MYISFAGSSAILCSSCTTDTPNTKHGNKNIENTQAAVFRRRVYPIEYLDGLASDGSDDEFEGYISEDAEPNDADDSMVGPPRLQFPTPARSMQTILLYLWFHLPVHAPPTPNVTP